MGVIILFVDSTVWAGKPIFNSVIDKLRASFMWEMKNDKAFTYVGISIKHKEDMLISIDQHTYAESLEIIPLNKDELSNPFRILNESDIISLRSAMQQLAWLANISQPDISFQVSSISSNIQQATVSGTKTANKIIKFIKDNKTHITFPPLHISSTKVIMYPDASFSNISDGCSQGGYLVFLADKNSTSCPISWKS